MTKEDVLQKVNDYCAEKQYTTETLTDEFKDKFSGFFFEKYKEIEGGMDDEHVLADLKFNLDTAFSATSKGVTSKQQNFDTKEAEYKRQIEELKKKVTPTKKVEEIKLPKEIEDKLDRLTKYEEASRKREKFDEILGIAKKSVREDLRKSFENYAKDFVVDTDKASDEQAKVLVNRFQEIFKDTIGDIKPLAPKITMKQESEFIEQIPKVKV